MNLCLPLVATRDWADATDRDYEVKGRPSREFYREAERWLRHEAASVRGIGEDSRAARREAERARARLQALRAAEGIS